MPVLVPVRASPVCYARELFVKFPIFPCLFGLGSGSRSVSAVVAIVPQSSSRTLWLGAQATGTDSTPPRPRQLVCHICIRMEKIGCLLWHAQRLWHAQNAQRPHDRPQQGLSLKSVVHRSSSTDGRYSTRARASAMIRGGLHIFTWYTASSPKRLARFVYLTYGQYIGTPSLPLV